MENLEQLKQRVKSKRTLYMCCFFAFMMIDWSRGSQIGVVWAWTVNMTGVIIAVILLSGTKFADWKKPVYVVYSCICIVAIPLAYLWWNSHQALIYRDKLMSAVINVWLLGLFTIKLFIDVVIRKTKKLYFTKIEIVMAVMLVFAFLSRNEDIWPIYYLVMFGLLYHSDFTHSDKKQMMQGLLDGIILGFFVLQGAAFVFRPFDDPTLRYYGIYGNPNMNALFYCIVFVAFLLNMHINRQKKGPKWLGVLYFLFAAAQGGFIALTICKTAGLALVLIGAIYLLAGELKQLQTPAKYVVVRLVLMCMIMAISLPIDYAVARYMPPVFHHPVWFDGEYSESRVHSNDPWNSDKYVSFSDVIGGISDRIGPYMELIGEKLVVHAEELDTQEQEDHRFDSATGRVQIWKYYLENGNLVGHSNQEGHGLNGEIGWYVWHAQNMFVQYWYYYGIPAAILFAIWVLTTLWKSFKKAWKENDTTSLMVFIFMLLFAVYGILEATWYPGQMILLLAFFLPVFLRERSEVTIKE